MLCMYVQIYKKRASSRVTKTLINSLKVKLRNFACTVVKRIKSYWQCFILGNISTQCRQSYVVDGTMSKSEKDSKNNLNNIQDKSDSWSKT